MTLDLSKVVPLVTGGGSGIGFGLVKEFLKRGSPKVLITGRREDVLQQAVQELGADRVVYKVSDAGSATDREDLLAWVQAEHPDMNALVNNAGIQRRIAPVNDTGSWEERAQEIEINLNGPVHLSTLFLPHLLSRSADGTPAILANVSSGLAFVPFAAGPVYAATKAAIHSYTMSMRYSLQDTNVHVVEIVPPAVQSNLGGSHAFGEDLDTYVNATMDRFEAGESEIGYNFSDSARLADRATLDGMMVQVAETMHVDKYPAPQKT
jgi:uncharacterized oxidoreductase